MPEIPIELTIVRWNDDDIANCFLLFGINLGQLFVLLIVNSTSYARTIWIFVLCQVRRISVPSTDNMDKRIPLLLIGQLTKENTYKKYYNFSTNVCIYSAASMRSNLATKTRSCVFITATSLNKSFETTSCFSSVAAVVFVQILPLCIFQTSITYIDVL
jgi:hypothetical protein